MTQRITSAIFLAIMLLLAFAAVAPAQATRPSPRIIRTQADFDAVLVRTPGGYRIPDDTTAYVGDVELRVDRTVELGHRVVLARLALSDARVSFVGTVRPEGGTVMFRMTGNASTVAGLKFDGGTGKGANGVNIRGDNCSFTGNTGANVNYFIDVEGADGTTLLNNYAPTVWGYLLYTHALVRETKDRGGRIVAYDVNPCVGLTAWGNRVGESLGESGGRIQETYDADLAYNVWGRPAVQKVTTNGRVEWVQKATLRVHSGRRIRVRDSEFYGGRKGGPNQRGILALGPMAGGDGGLRDDQPVRRAYKLALTLRDVQVYNNRLDDVVIELFPGLHDVLIENNAFDFCRAQPLVYEASETLGGELLDYRPHRGEPTGTIRGNAFVRAPGNTKPIHNMPPSVPVRE